MARITPSTLDECCLCAGRPDDQLILACTAWCVAMRGVEGGGLVEGLPVHNFYYRRRRYRPEVPDRSSDHGSPRKGTGGSGICSARPLQGHGLRGFLQRATCQKPKVYDTDSANANARLSAQLPYIMAVSRFAHYLKAMMRDKIGSFMSREEAERFLNRWITNYVTPDDMASPATKAQRPLREARIEVTEVAGKPGVYRAVAFLRPHFQLDELTVSLRLVAELPGPAK